MAVWVLNQIGQFALLVVLLCGAGIILSMSRRQFSYRALLAGVATLVLGVVGLGYLLVGDPLGLAARAVPLVWAGGLGFAVVAGFFTGLAGRRVGFWESELALIIVALLTVVQLAKGWPQLLGLSDAGMLDTWDLMTASPGVRYLGPLWDRVFAVIAIAGFALAVFGGSLAYLFFSERGRADVSFKLEWFIGKRHLKKGGRGMVSVTAAVAVIGIAIGVGALVAVTAVMSGYQEDIQEKILTTNAHLVIQKYGIDFTEYESVERKALTVPGVLAATPFTFNEAMLSDGERGLGVLIKGIDPKSAGAVTGLEQSLCTPASAATRSCTHLGAAASHETLISLLTPRDGVPGIILGSELAKKVGLPIGSPVLLTTPIGIAGARGNAPKRMEFRITGTFRSGMHDFDARLAYLDLGASQRLMGMGQSVNGVEFRVQDPNAVDVIASKVLRVLGRYPYHSLDWRELNSGIFAALNYQKVVMFLVLTWIVIVAAFSIASTLFMAVVERAHEIGVLKSMGVRDANIMKIFVLQGWVVGGIGTIIGVIIGLAVCAVLSQVPIPIAADVYMVESLKVRVWPLEILLTVLAALIISHLATIYPALKAARQRPVDAMRYE